MDIEGVWVAWGYSNESHRTIRAVYAEEVEALRALNNQDTDLDIKRVEFLEFGRQWKW